MNQWVSEEESERVSELVTEEVSEYLFYGLVDDRVVIIWLNK